MRITIENFGPVKHFEFDTEKDLFLIFGKNSVGKSYAISLVYLILKNMSELNRTFLRSTKNIVIPREGDKFNKSIDDDKKQLERMAIGNTNKHYNLLVYVHNKYVIDDLLLYLNDFVKILNDSISNTFNDLDNLRNSYSTGQLRISIKWTSFDMAMNIGLKKNTENLMEFYVTEYFLNQEDFLKEVEYDFSKSIRDSDIEYDEKNMELCYIAIFNDLAYKLSNDLENISNVYYLPASRSGTYQALSSFSQIFVEISKNRSRLSKQAIPIPAISEPIADFFEQLSNINIHNNLCDTHHFYANEIEKEILRGSVEFDNVTKQLFFVPNNTNLKLGLSAVSSMVSELSLVVSYLKYIISAYGNPLLFIEEPEAHLHPETQVKLMEVFARLVNDGKIKLVMTSHSNYIFNKASNLVMDGKLAPDKFEALLFRMTEAGSVAEKMPTDAYGIDDDNFIDTAESLYEEKLSIINKMNG